MPPVPHPLSYIHPPSSPPHLTLSLLTSCPQSQPHYSKAHFLIFTHALPQSPPGDQGHTLLCSSSDTLFFPPSLAHVSSLFPFSFASLHGIYQSHVSSFPFSVKKFLHSPSVALHLPSVVFLMLFFILTEESLVYSLSSLLCTLCAYETCIQY